MKTLPKSIFDRLKGSPKVLICGDFLDLGGRAAVDQALSRLVRGGRIARVGRGLYYVTRHNPRLGITVLPDADDIARRTGSANRIPSATFRRCGRQSAGPRYPGACEGRVYNRWPVTAMALGEPGNSVQTCRPPAGSTCRIRRARWFSKLSDIWGKRMSAIVPWRC